MRKDRHQLSALSRMLRRFGGLNLGQFSKNLPCHVETGTLQVMNQTVSQHLISNSVIIPIVIIPNVIIPNATFVLEHYIMLKKRFENPNILGYHIHYIVLIIIDAHMMYNVLQM